jgi:14-3-3 protein epsilon
VHRLIFKAKRRVQLDEPIPSRQHFIMTDGLPEWKVLSDPIDYFKHSLVDKLLVLPLTGRDASKPSSDGFMQLRHEKQSRKKSRATTRPRPLSETQMSKTCRPGIGSIISKRPTDTDGKRFPRTGNQPNGIERNAKMGRSQIYNYMQIPGENRSANKEGQNHYPHIRILSSLGEHLRSQKVHVKIMSSETDLLFYLARVADKIERHDHTVEYMTKLVQCRPKLTSDERRLLHSGYREYVAPYREALRLFDPYLDEAVNDADSERIAMLTTYSERYRAALDVACRNIIELVDTVLLVHTNEPVACAFYHKMKGDYFRYLAEFASPGTAHEYAKNAELSYKTALSLSRRELKNSDPLYLTIALTYSICEYELSGNHQEAVEFAERIFSEAVKTVDGLNKKDYAEATSIMQLLRENISRWSDPSSRP